MQRSVLSASAIALMLGFTPALQAQSSDTPSTVSSSAGQLQVEQLATLEYPWGMAVLPNGRVLLTEKPGRLRIWQDGALSEPLEGVPEVVFRGTGDDQGGLLDVALDPDFTQNNLIYLSYVEAAEPQPAGMAETGDARFADYLDMDDNIVRGAVVARARLNGNQLGELQVIWRQEPKTVGRGHFGNRLLFGSDGMLYITSGERMRFDPAQDLSSNLGKVVRIHPDGSVPEDNPFADQDDARGEIWTLGHRNILAVAFDGQQQLWAFEMGPLGGDEVNLIEKGKNYGWPEVSDGAHYDKQTIPPHDENGQYTRPVRTWTPVVSPSGAHWYDGSLFGSDWQNSMLVGGLTSKGLVRLTFNGQSVADEERINLDQRVRDVAQAQDGAILLLIDAEEGSLLRLSPAQ